MNSQTEARDGLGRRAERGCGEGLTRLQCLLLRGDETSEQRRLREHEWGYYCWSGAFDSVPTAWYYCLCLSEVDLYHASVSCVYFIMKTK